MAAAAAAANGFSANAPGAVSAECPKPEPREAIEVRVFDEADQPVASVALELQRSPESVVLALTDGEGHARFDGLVPGSYQLALPATDEKAWELIRQEALPPPSDKSSGDAGWQAPVEGGQPETWEVRLGDSMSSIAFHCGLLPETVWSFRANAGLQASRQHKQILHPGDVVHLPRRQRKSIGASTTNRYDLRRKGVPEMLRIRFLDFQQEPCREVPYLLNLQVDDGTALPAREGRTDGAGFLIEPIPPNLAEAVVLLGRAPEVRETRFRLGYVNPVGEMSGAQARLNNLGYWCGEESGEETELTVAALRRFQADQGLEPTGKLDGETKARLQQDFLS